jgi:hypothetical protein
LRQKKSEYPPYFVGEDRATTASRWLFILAIDRLIPKCFKTLRNDEYPVFASLPSPNSAADQKELQALFARWAAPFHLERDEWIHHGVLETLSRWQLIAKPGIFSYPAIWPRSKTDHFTLPWRFAGLWAQAHWALPHFIIRLRSVPFAKYSSCWNSRFSFRKRCA